MTEAGGWGGRRRVVTWLLWAWARERAQAEVLLKLEKGQEQWDLSRLVSGRPWRMNRWSALTGDVGFPHSPRAVWKARSAGSPIAPTSLCIHLGSLIRVLLHP